MARQPPMLFLKSIRRAFYAPDKTTSSSPHSLIPGIRSLNSYNRQSKHSFNFIKMGFKTIVPLALLSSLQYANAAPAPQFPGFPGFGGGEVVTVTITHIPSGCTVSLPTGTSSHHHTSSSAAAFPGFEFGGQGSTGSGGGIIFPGGGV